MSFCIFMLLSCLLVPGMLLLFGWMFRSHAPKTINYAFGYRTKRSMKNEETWRFAQAEFGRHSLRWGLAELPVTLLVMAAIFGRDEGTVGTISSALCFVLCVPLLIMIWQVERALKKHFDENGKRKLP